MIHFLSVWSLACRTCLPWTAVSWRRAAWSFSFCVPWKKNEKKENRVGTTWSWTSYDCILIWAFKIKSMCLLPPKLTFIQVSVVREELNGLHPTVRSDSCTQSPKRLFLTNWMEQLKETWLSASGVLCCFYTQIASFQAKNPWPTCISANINSGTIENLLYLITRCIFRL